MALMHKMETEKVLYSGRSEFEHYQVVDMVYTGRAARVLFSGQRRAAQSAIPLDGDPRMLFDYNQRLLELVESLKPKKVLQIGGGVFTLATEILKTFPNIEVDAIEHDTGLEKIAKRYFGLKPNKRLNIIIDDGREYLSRTQKTYDLILLDAFTHSAIPDALATKEFVELISRHLHKNAVVAANVISAYHGPNDTALKQQYATYKSVFKHTDIYPADNILSYWISQNFILISSNKIAEPKYILRFDSLQPPPNTPSDIRHD